jgi:hypothetical protein
VRGSDLIVVGSRARGPLGRLRAWHQGGRPRAVPSVRC